jgi:hypothetical protein
MLWIIIIIIIYYLIKFNVCIDIIHGFTSLGASSRSTFVLALHGQLHRSLLVSSITYNALDCVLM